MTTSAYRELILRALVPAEDAQDIQSWLEPCGQNIWLSRTTRCSRHNVIGVPAKRVDVLVQDGIADEDGLICVEVVRKTGKYDGAVRTRLAFRRMHHGMEAIDGCRVALKMDEECTLRVVRGGDVLWSQTFDRLRAEASPHGVRDLVMWHWSRYFRHLDSSTAESVVAGLVIPEGTTITAANRIASNRLYEESRSLGWIKLTRRERDKLSYPAAAGAWQREEHVARMRAVRAGVAHPTGCGEYTLEAAR